MVVDERTLSHACATRLRGRRQGLDEATFLEAWTALRAWVVETNNHYRGACIHTFARVVWEHSNTLSGRPGTAASSCPDGNQLVLVPRFAVSDSFLRAHALAAGPGVVRTATLVGLRLQPTEDINFTKLAIRYSTKLTKDLAFTAIRHLLQELGDTLGMGAHVAVDFGVGTLHAKERRLEFEWRPDLVTPKKAAAIPASLLHSARIMHQRLGTGQSVLPDPSATEGGHEGEGERDESGATPPADPAPEDTGGDASMDSVLPQGDTSHQQSEGLQNSCTAPGPGAHHQHQHQQHAGTLPAHTPEPPPSTWLRASLTGGQCGLPTAGGGPPASLPQRPSTSSGQQAEGATNGRLGGEQQQQQQSALRASTLEFLGRGRYRAALTGAESAPPPALPPLPPAPTRPGTSSSRCSGRFQGGSLRQRGGRRLSQSQQYPSWQKSHQTPPLKLELPAAAVADVLAILDGRAGHEGGGADAEKSDGALQKPGVGRGAVQAQPGAVPPLVPAVMDSSPVRVDTRDQGRSTTQQQQLQQGAAIHGSLKALGNDQVLGAVGRVRQGQGRVRVGGGSVEVPPSPALVEAEQRAAQEKLLAEARERAENAALDARLQELEGRAQATAEARKQRERDLKAYLASQIKEKAARQQSEKAAAAQYTLPATLTDDDQLAHKRQAAASVWVQEVGAQVAERARAAREARAGREAEEQAAAREAERQLAGQVLEARLRTRALADEQRAELQQQELDKRKRAMMAAWLEGASLAQGAKAGGGRRPGSRGSTTLFGGGAESVVWSESDDPGRPASSCSALMTVKALRL